MARSELQTQRPWCSNGSSSSVLLDVSDLALRVLNVVNKMEQVEWKRVSEKSAWDGDEAFQRGWPSIPEEVIFAQRT